MTRLIFTHVLAVFAKAFSKTKILISFYYYYFSNISIYTIKLNLIPIYFAARDKVFSGDQ